MSDLFQGSSSNWMDLLSEGAAHLPPDTIPNIISKLPIKSILRCKSVCKAWYSLIRDPQFAKLHLSGTIHKPPRFALLTTSQSKLLLVDCEGCNVEEILVVENSFHAIMGSCNGMLCVASVEALDPLQIWNPITREYIVLPKSDVHLPVIDHRVDIGFDPSIGKYKVVRVYNEFLVSRVYKFEIITLGETSWRELDTPFNIIEIGKEASIFSNGCFYWVHINAYIHGWDDIQILSLDIVDEKFRTISFPPILEFPPFEPMWLNWTFLNLGGFLSLTALDQRRIGECDGYQLMHVWQLITNKDKSLHIRYQHTCNLHVIGSLSYNALISEGNNNSYLLKAFSLFNNVPQLVQYFTESKDHLILNVPWIGYRHSSTSFEPSFVSPRGALLGLP